MAGGVLPPFLDGFDFRRSSSLTLRASFSTETIS